MKTVRSIARKIFCLIIVAILIFAGYNIYLRVTHKTDFSDLVKCYSNEYGVDEHLILAVIKCESSFDKEAVSSAGARGLMQLTEETFYDVRKMVGNGEEYTFETQGILPICLSCLTATRWRRLPPITQEWVT